MHVFVWCIQVCVVLRQCVGMCYIHVLVCCCMDVSRCVVYMCMYVVLWVFLNVLHTCACMLVHRRIYMCCVHVFVCHCIHVSACATCVCILFYGCDLCMYVLLLTKNHTYPRCMHATQMPAILAVYVCMYVCM